MYRRATRRCLLTYRRSLSVHRREARRQPVSSSLLQTLQQLPPPPALVLLDTTARRSFSDRLLGHSPMAPSSPANKETSSIPTAHDVSVAGGVWAPTSAKRDKLAEYNVALDDNQVTLDDAATDKERLDLYLADGLRCLAQTTDQVEVDDIDEAEVLKDLTTWLATERISLPEELHQVQWEEHLHNVIRQVDRLLEMVPPDRYLKSVRDFFDASVQEGQEPVTTTTQAAQFQNDEKFNNILEHAVLRFRLLLTKAAAENLLEQWKTLTAVSDQDVDRAAVQGITLEPHRSTLPTALLHETLESYLLGTCADRVDAVWKLLDRDQDGLLDEAEMNQVCQTVLEPVQSALRTLMEEALQAYPVQAPLELLDEMNVPPPGWRQRRREAKHKKKLLKMFQKTLQYHFQDEVEMPHRLRCIYAWANKAHQDNAVDSVLVEESGWSGRKRYVELQPKISLPEFREVQQVHFTHLDRIGTEFLTSFREDLWLVQGKRRENRELMRDCAGFLTVVCAIDFLITSL